MNSVFDQFKGSADYVTSEPLRNAVNVSIALGRPLLIRGEPGTGKTLLAHSIAQGLGKQADHLEHKIDHQGPGRAVRLRYGAAVERQPLRRQGCLRHQADYIKLGKLGQAFAAPEQVVLLIDEVDKADIEFPNDLLNELDEMSFYIPETNETVTAIHRPITVITSNAEKELPDAFLRRCIFHYIEFPDATLMEKIVRVHFPDIKHKLSHQVLDAFYALRNIDDLRKKPSTSELIDWLRALIAAGLSGDDIVHELPFLGSLLKRETDYQFVKAGRSRAVRKDVH